MSTTVPLHPRLERIQPWALYAGAAALLVSFAGSWLNPGQFYQSYLAAYLYWVGIAIGCIGLVMLHHLVGGQWGFLVRRLLEAGASTLWLMALLFLPLIPGLKYLYPWARPENENTPASAFHKIYLSVDLFIFRTCIYFAIWILLGFLLTRWSSRQDQTADPAWSARLESLSGPGLVILFLSASFASIDWGMSLEPDWYSTIYGAMFVTGQALATLAFVTAIAAMLSGDPPLASLAQPSTMRDLGNLLLAFVMLWAYMAFSQFLIIWCGNLTEEIPWYMRRTRGGWQWVALSLILFHFFLPFFVLLFQDMKRSPRALLAIAVAILFMHGVDLFWLVAPAFRRSALDIHWLDFVTCIGIGGLWLGMFVRQLKLMPLVPLHDPRLAKALEHAKGI
jgi:hypothetical protein